MFGFGIKRSFKTAIDNKLSKRKERFFIKVNPKVGNIRKSIKQTFEKHPVKSYSVKSVSSADKLILSFAVKYHSIRDITLKDPTTILARQIKKRESKIAFGCAKKYGTSSLKRVLDKVITQLEIAEKQVFVAKTAFKLTKLSKTNKVEVFVDYISKSQIPKQSCRTKSEFEAWIKANLKAKNSQFSINVIDSKKIKSPNTIFKECVKTFGDYFSNSLHSSRVQSLGRGESKIVHCMCSFLTSIKQDKALEKWIEQAGKTLNLKNLSDLKKVETIHDYIAQKVAYDNRKRYFSAYDAAIGGEAVCDGYSLLAQKFFELFGIRAVIIKSPQMNHSWNLVSFGGSWYHIDITWDSQLSQNPPSRQYFCLSDSDFLGGAKPHFWNRAKYPRASRSLKG